MSAIIQTYMVRCGYMDERMEGQMDGWMEGWMDEWMDIGV
jgi:hypothetical protein